MGIRVEVATPFVFSPFHHMASSDSGQPSLPEGPDGEKPNSKTAPCALQLAANKHKAARARFAEAFQPGSAGPTDYKWVILRADVLDTTEELLDTIVALWKATVEKEAAAWKQ